MKKQLLMLAFLLSALTVTPQIDLSGFIEPLKDVVEVLPDVIDQVDTSGTISPDIINVDIRVGARVVSTLIPGVPNELLVLLSTLLTGIIGRWFEKRALRKKGQLIDKPVDKK